MALERELVARDDLAAVACGVHEDAAGRVPLHAQLGGPRVVLEDLLDLRRLLAAALVDSVEALRVRAGVVIQLELRVGPELQLVARLSRRDRARGRVLGFEVLVGQLEAVVPQHDLRGLELLGLLPGVDAVLLAGAPPHALEDQRALDRKIRMAPRVVRDDQRVTAGAVLEEVEDSLFFHQAAREREVGLAVLHAVVARFERPLDLPADLEGGGENLFQNVGNRKVLKDAALRFLGKQEGLRDEVEHKSRERGVPRTLRDSQASPVDEALCASRQGDLDRDLLAQERVEDDFLRVRVLSDTLELKEEGLGDRFVSRETAQDQDVGGQLACRALSTPRTGMAERFSSKLCENASGPLLTGHALKS